MMKLSRRSFLLGGVVILPYLSLERQFLAVRRYRVPIRDLPPSFEGFTILHLSDLHDKEFGKENERLIGMIAQERFDMVALTGDLVVGGAPSLLPALQIIAGIKRSSNVPLYSVPGNHDWMLRRGDEFNRQLTEAGVTVLSNRSTVLEAGGQRLFVVGVDDPVTRRDRLDEALKETDQGAVRLLLCHSPQLLPQASRHGIDLMLSGHTHGGQFRLPILGACYVPALGIFPRWDYGRFNSGRTTLIVSGGLGESCVPIRINIRPEFSVITLVRHQEPS
ncbi:metallophosphoesterase [Geomonas sp.]|uniref:metallophosphoesterase n=1 Tax=Geomonas sp. TaxID=2651584 RepID=UPI002B48BD53|nr:metallophosphoesterase [Geomonas sp.]HJV36969.1 metallophosphoesterase [Geomonas sp.]